MLRPYVAEIFMAHSVEEGLAIWRKQQPDVTLTEIETTEVDGLAMSRLIKADDPDAAIIVISSSTASEHLRLAIDVGVDGYIFKPVDSVLLLDLIARALRDRKRVLDLKMGHMVFAVANEGILVTDEVSRIVAVNPAFSEITGYRPDEVIGQKTKLLSAGQHPPEFYRAMWDALNSHGRWSGEIINRRKDGVVFSEWLSIAAVDGEFQRGRRYVGLISDISDRKKEEEYIRRLAHFDSLTGLPNRVLFNDRLQRALVRAKRYRQSLAVLYVDLDHFKEINDTYGHAAGDEALKIVAARLLSTLRQNDTVSRRGGDEFVVIVELTEHPEGIGNVCNKLLTELRQPFRLAGQWLELGASIGVANFPGDASEPEALLAAADAALYEAKTAGRGVFRFFEAEAQKTACTRLEMERELRAGLKNWRYQVHYLPEISLVTGGLENVEALLRFHHPEFGLLEAGRFLEIAEEIGIMPELGQKALAEAVGEILALSENYADLGLVIDLSARQLCAPDAVSHLLDTLVRAGMPTQRITFECSENALSGNEAAMQTLFGLASSGCKFTLDDFGAGFCSFSLISQLPMTSIKIDRSFTREIDSNPQIRQLVAALIAFGKRLGMRTVAEGVETERQIEFLRQSRCDTAQGYVFGRPMNSQQLRQFIVQENWRPMLCC
ncbi:MAG: diguanylate cyclase/phosphodiesterase with sensor [Proteobacteria bacterium]|nr:diguanylate cyclase/phosphodiesterase with sensor [Pseudomonadota bacterium]